MEFRKCKTFCGYRVITVKDTECCVSLPNSLCKNIASVQGNRDWLAVKIRGGDCYVSMQLVDHGVEGGRAEVTLEEAARWIETQKGGGATFVGMDANTTAVCDWERVGDGVMEPLISHKRANSWERLSYWLERLDLKMSNTWGSKK